MSKKKDTLIMGVAQLGPISRNDSRKSVVKRLLELLAEAADRRCQVLVFPELALTTFFPRWLYETQEEVDFWFEKAMPGKETKVLFEKAEKAGIGFYLGFAELAKEEGVVRHFNTSILVDQKGEIVGRYRKIHLPGTIEPVPGAPFQHLEKRYFEVGDRGFPVWKAFGTRTGMCLCNDRRWPETFRVMALKGAEMVLLGYNTPDYNIHHNEPKHLRMFHNHLSLQSAAYQNALWIGAAAKAGIEDGFNLIGGSCIISPTGEIVSLANTEEDELITASCDLHFGDYIRRSVFNFEKHRRIEHYGIITSQTGIKIDTEN